MKLLKQSWHYFANVMTFLSTVITITAIFGVFDDLKGLPGADTAKVLMLLIGILYVFSVLVYGIKHRRFKIKIRGDMEIAVQRGNLFQKTGNIVVPVNCFFDTIVGQGVVSEESWHGKLIYEIFKGDLKDLEQQMARELSSVKGVSLNRACGKNIRYPYGTIIKVKRDGRKFFLVALTDFDEENHVKAEEARINYCDVMGKLVQYIAKNSEGLPTFLPPVGMGLARIFDSQEDCIRTMVQVFRLMQQTFPAPIEIVVEEGFWKLRQEM